MIGLGAVDTFTVAANGTIVDARSTPVKYFSVQVKGTGAAATAWSVVVEGSLNGVQFTTLLTHGTADGDGATKPLSVATPCSYFRARLVSVTLGSATDVKASVLGVQ